MTEEQIRDIFVKVSVLENKLSETEKDFSSFDREFSDLKKELEKLKYDIVTNRNLIELETRIKQLESQIDAFRQELPEMRMIKKIVIAAVTFMITAFLSLIWNSVIPDSKDSLPEVAKKISQEYKKSEIKP